ncbi:MAG: alpha-amylase/4-alpha-glucanotransferase domain-containing protein [Gammaproteobacteria bacterium]
MTRPVSLLLGVHAHQPVGNFPAVIVDAHERCYRPFLHTLHRYPEFRFAAHFSGWLLDELCARFPDDMALLGEMVARGQVELFGAGDCEPVLAAIPARDRLGQLQALTAKLQSRYGATPAGAWLTERVWESSVVPSLVDGGMRYVTVDDYHFLCTGLEAQALDGHFTTEEDGRTLDLFPISELLRYRLPFAPAAEAVACLEGLAEAGQAAAIYFDDIEKFGIWPETYDWVYTRGWLAAFIEGVLASPRIEARTYAEFHRTQPTRGIVYLPTASYSEMNEWTLPAPAAHAYAALLADVKRSPQWPRERPFIRGGIWRNFLTRYPEANWQHKRMLALSARLAADPVQRENPALRGLLYRAQANDAYWHGLFGGLYLPHLRRAVWSHLLELETALDAQAWPRPAPGDLDHDGHVEHLLANRDLQAVLRDDGRGALIELSSYALCHNFGDVLRRHAEHYHRLPEEAAAELHGAPGDGGIASAHDRVAWKHAIAPADLVPDAQARTIASDCLIGADGSRTPIADYRVLHSDARSATLEARPAPDCVVRKTYLLDGAALLIDWTVSAPTTPALEVELNLALPSCDGYGGRYRLADGSFPGGFGQDLALDACAALDCEDAALEGRLTLAATPPAAVHGAPHETVSQSEAGLEKIMQGACLRLRWQAPQLRLALSVSPCPSWL